MLLAIAFTDSVAFFFFFFLNKPAALSCKFGADYVLLSSLEEDAFVLFIFLSSVFFFFFFLVKSSA